MQGVATSDVTVIVRVRPLLDVDHKQCKAGEEVRGVLTNNATVALLGGQLPKKMHAERRRRGDVHTDMLYWKLSEANNLFTFDAVLAEKDSTEAAFLKTGFVAVSELVDRGNNAVVFGFGQTGSGKTYTLLGNNIADEIHVNLSHADHSHGIPTFVGISSDREGIAIRTFECLLHRLQQSATSENSIVKYTIEVSAVEIYLDLVCDLLADGDKEALRIYTRTRKQTLSQLSGEVCDLYPKETFHVCHDVQAFKQVLHRVQLKRAQNSTKMNDRSSRSHLILTLSVQSTYTGRQADSHEQSNRKLILVDLAGNERDSSRENRLNESILREEGIAVNTSLLALAECLRERAKRSSAARKQRHDEDCVRHGSSQGTATGKADGERGTGCGTAKTPNAGAGIYRKSVLTRLLKEHLEGAKLFFLACCSPAAGSGAATRHTLTYARKVKHITTNAEDSALLFDQGFPVEVLPHDKLIEHGKIPRSSDALTVPFHGIRESVVRVMVSHKWLMPTEGYPDNWQNAKHDLLCALFERMHAGGWIRNYNVVNVVDWIDFGEGAESCSFESFECCVHATEGVV